MANAEESPGLDWGGTPSTERSMPSLLGQALFTPRRLSMEELSSIEASPPGPLQQEEQNVPQQQAMVQRMGRRQEFNRDRVGDQGADAQRRRNSRTPYERLPSSDRGNDDLSLALRRTALPGGNRDTSSERALYGRGQALVLGCWLKRYFHVNS